MGAGVFFGATKICHPLMTTGTPCSVRVGMLSAEGIRFSELTPSILILPPLACGSATDKGTIMASTSPEATAVIAGAAP
jgi:hypothetical protein